MADFLLKLIGFLSYKLYMSPFENMNDKILIFETTEINDTTYRLKLLSSTNNPTVIFSMNYIKIPTSNGLELIQQNLKL